MPFIQTVNIISELATKYGLQYTKTLVQGQTPTAQNNNGYSGKIDADVYLVSDTPIAISPLSTPVFTNIVFKGANYKNPFTGTSSSFADIEFQTVLITVSQAKKIVKTEIQGRDGTVKEYIGMDDYQVTVNAIINGANYTYPWAQISAIKQMLDAPVPVDVQCKYLNGLGINTVVVGSYEIGQEEGMYSQQKISINCISDTPILLQRLTNVNVNRQS